MVATTRSCIASAKNSRTASTSTTPRCRSRYLARSASLRLRSGCRVGDSRLEPSEWHSPAGWVAPATADFCGATRGRTMGLGPRLCRCHPGPALECVVEGADLGVAEQPGDL